MLLMQTSQLQLSAGLLSGGGSLSEGREVSAEGMGGGSFLYGGLGNIMLPHSAAPAQHVKVSRCLTSQRFHTTGTEIAGDRQQRGGRGGAEGGRGSLQY